MRRPVLLALLLCGVAGASEPWPLRDGAGQPTERVVDADVLLGPAGDLDTPAVITDPAALGAVAEATAAWLRRAPDDDPAADPGILRHRGVDRDDVLRTLDAIARLAREAPERLSDPAFLARHLTAIPWRADQAGAAAAGIDLPDHRIRLTRYLVDEVSGRAAPAPGFDHALYADPGPPLRTALTRQQVMDGAYRPGGRHAGEAEPLVWLPRRGVHEALMQGTVAVTVDGRQRVFNVHQNNGRSYVHGQPDPEQQPRYWYFREVEAVLGYGDEARGKIPLAAGAAAAGDVHDLPLGVLIGLQTPGGLRLVILADTGGAFQPNLHQLDWFAGTFPTRDAFLHATRDLPSRVHARFLVWRPEGSDPR